MKDFTLIITFMCWYYSIQSQQINPAGGSTEKEEFSAEWIIGGSLIDNSILSTDSKNQEFIYAQPDYGLIEVYPTVTRDFLTIKCNYPEIGTLDFKITNNSGTALIIRNLNISNPFELDVKHLAAGHYIIIFSSGNDNSFYLTKQFIKL
jgi:hypothetical protein